MSMLDVAIQYRQAGLCVLPAALPLKRPSLAEWKPYMERLPTEAELKGWFGCERPMCIVTGAVSGGLEVLDFDVAAELYEPWRARIAAKNQRGLLNRLVIERTVNGGRHLLYRHPSPPCGSMKLAQRTQITPTGDEIEIAGKRYVPRWVGDHWEVLLTLIETKGEGGLFLCAPSPGYHLAQGSFASIPLLTEAERDLLLSEAAELNQYAAPPAPQRLTTTHEDEGRPGDDFNQRGVVRELLCRHGWKMTRGGENEHWARPGKPHGTSATLKDGVFYVFSSNAAPFEPEQSYSLFSVYTLLEHGGDFEAAARQLRIEGYGATEPASDVDLSNFSTGNSPEPDPPSDTRLPDPGPLPERLLRVPGLIGEVMAYNLATAIKPQPILALAGAIGLQAVLAARKVQDERGNRTNLYVVGIAESGAGKDHARKVNRNILFQSGVDHLEGTEDIASDAGLITAIEAQPAVLFQMDEFGRFLKTIGDPKRAPHLFNVISALMKLYSSADTIFRGKAYADAKRNKVIDQPCVSLYGTTVPEHFFESLTTDVWSDGFVARLLAFESVGNPSRQRVPQQPVPESIVEAARWWGELRPGGDLRNEHPQPIVVPYSPEAARLFDAFSERIDRELANASQGKSLWARAEEKACRLSLVYACSADRAKLVIDGAATRWACDLVEHLTRRLLHLATQWASDGHFDAKQQRAWRLLHKAGRELTGYEVSHLLRWMPRRERMEVLDNLIETGRLRSRTEPTGTKPKTLYSVV